ncbi:hypothetical protein Bpfe_008682 [Biomphalaria pfeifferi]|uniref:MD-2-related lipid-recognition domain-containing protein n=1 Tax=Biomphalaria pfeifferi TaxID=112525 RepID=A0AAD8BVT5_BIOPF|nr:hypothetical protein Bpfe_008682 [Biomphalaria pfeifferi]
MCLNQTLNDTHTHIFTHTNTPRYTCKTDVWFKLNMDTTLHILLFIYFCVYTLAHSRDSNVNKMSVKKGPFKVADSGHAINCGVNPINVTWTPKDLVSSGEVTIFVSYPLPHDLDSGFFNASLFFHGDSLPFLGYADNYNCDLLKKYIHICPLPKGVLYPFSKTITNLHILTSYPGTYDAILQAWNSKQEEMFCVNITITVVEESLQEDDFF